MAIEFVWFSKGDIIIYLGLAYCITMLFLPKRFKVFYSNHQVVVELVRGVIGTIILALLFLPGALI